MSFKVEMIDITKTFGTLVANDQVSVQVEKGEIHAILGENGAGKSTLMSILFGLYQQDSGLIKIDDQIVHIKNPNDATKLGIGMVHQHFKLVETFTALENIILGAEDSSYGFLKYDEAIRKLNDLIETYHLKVDLYSLIKNIGVGQQQRIEILKMLYRDSEILIFDEPTAVLTPQEIKELMNIMRGFAKEGKTIILITHKLNEIKAVADRVTVLRRGQCVGTVDVKDVTIEKMAEMMVGREVVFTIQKEDQLPGELVFEVDDLSILGRDKQILTNISFHVKKGEIVGLAGIDGNGQTELIHALTGLIPISSGSVKINGEDISKLSVRKKYEHGLSHIPEDRQKHGIILDFNLESNLILQSYYLPKYQNKSFLKFKEIQRNAEKLIETFDIRSEKGAKTLTRSMSGGNQQKAIVAREIDRNHDLLIAVQPTRGLDVGAIEYIHHQLLRERKEGKGILMISLELEEIMSLSDRILVIYEGEITANLDPKEITVNELGLYMSGAKRGKINA
jgi:general nucleoside transport system ATP-binding protein